MRGLGLMEMPASILRPAIRDHRETAGSHFEGDVAVDDMESRRPAAECQSPVRRMLREQPGQITGGKGGVDDNTGRHRNG